jgi:hypothetical protein
MRIVPSSTRPARLSIGRADVLPCLAKPTASAHVRHLAGAFASAYTRTRIPAVPGFRHSSLAPATLASRTHHERNIAPTQRFRTRASIAQTSSLQPCDAVCGMAPLALRAAGAAPAPPSSRASQSATTMFQSSPLRETRCKCEVASANARDLLLWLEATWSHRVGPCDLFRIHTHRNAILATKVFLDLPLRFLKPLEHSSAVLADN